MSLLAKSKLYFSTIMVLVYLGVAFVFAFTDLANHLMNEQRRTVFAVIVATYAGFKSYMLFRKFKNA